MLNENETEKIKRKFNNFALNHINDYLFDNEILLKTDYEKIKRRINLMYPLHK